MCGRARPSPPLVFGRPTRDQHWQQGAGTGPHPGPRHRVHATAAPMHGPGRAGPGRVAHRVESQRNDGVGRVAPEARDRGPEAVSATETNQGGVGAPAPAPATVLHATGAPCTALAPAGRVELLTESHRSATTELDGVLREIETWAPEQVQAPDTTMVALAAAALQDLRERMAQAPTSTLEGRISRALDVLHALMASAPLRALA